MQFVQVELVVAPSTSENVPGQHSRQFAEIAMPVPVWYVPAPGHAQAGLERASLAGGAVG